MSSKVGAGEALPRFSLIFGPGGTLGSAGAGPRLATTSVQMTTLLFASQSQGSPVAAFRRSRPLIIRARPFATSAIHNSIALGLVFRNDRRVPSGEKRTFEM